MSNIQNPIIGFHKRQVKQRPSSDASQEEPAPTDTYVASVSSDYYLSESVSRLYKNR